MQVPPQTANGSSSFCHKCFTVIAEQPDVTIRPV